MRLAVKLWSMASCCNINLWWWHLWNVSCKLAKKESFWFKPTPFSYEKPRKEKTMTEQPTCYDLEEARKEFAYSIEPFRQVVSKRNLKYNQEIGLRWSGWALWKRSTYFSIWNWLNLILQQVNANAWNA